MPIRIILRNQVDINLFRDLIIKTIISKQGDSILLCSGFFQEGRGNYFASHENHFLCHLKKSKKKIIVIGIHNNCWIKEYRKFLTSLRNGGIDVDGRLHIKFHWHAKVYLVIKENIPIFGIIGSSNLTRNAFSISTNPFNIESDVVLWNEDNIEYNNIVNSSLNEVNPQSYYTVQYNSNENKNILYKID